MTVNNRTPHLSENCQKFHSFLKIKNHFLDLFLTILKLKMSDSDKEENDEVGKDKNVILHVAVVGFHHKKGMNHTI